MSLLLHKIKVISQNFKLCLNDAPLCVLVNQITVCVQKIFHNRAKLYCGIFLFQVFNNEYSHPHCGAKLHYRVFLFYPFLQFSSS